MKRITAILALAALAAVCVNCSKEEAEWKPAGDRIRTQWAAEVGPRNAHPEYPRPHLVREKCWKSLNGLWDYAIVQGGAAAGAVTQAAKPEDTQGAPAAFPQQADGKILVPFCVESSLSGVGRTVTENDVLWYRRTFKKPSWKKTILHFDAVDWDATVYVNGQEAGRHTGGYTAFSMDITPYIIKGNNTLEVRVKDGTDNGEQPRGKQVMMPGGIWYTAVSGIWQSVWMEAVPESYIAEYHAVPDVDNSCVTVSAEVPDMPEGASVRVNVYEGGVGYSTEDRPGKLIGSAPAGEAIGIEKPQLWSPESPYLYALELVLEDRDGRKLDTVRGYTALRKSSVVPDSAGIKRLGLNGKPYFHFGPLDQGWWPDGLYTAPTDEALRFDIEKTKEFGFNMIRKHIKVEPERWYWWCDRLGVLVWQDMPSLTSNLSGQWGEWGYDQGFDYPLTATAKETYYREWADVIAERRNFPSIVVWVPFNEAWSQFDTEAVASFTKDLDPTRLVNPASGGNHRLCGDILDSHNYPDPTMKVRSGGRQVDVLGEYGGLGLPLEGHLWQPDRNWGYIGFHTAEEVISKYEEFASRLASTVADGVSAAVYTQTTDVEIEVNGLMTYDRIPKLDLARLRAANLSVISALQP